MPRAKAQDLSSAPNGTNKEERHAICVPFFFICKAIFANKGSCQRLKTCIGVLFASLFLFGFGGGSAEKGAVIAVEAGVVPKAHRLANRGGGLPKGEHLLRE